MIFMEDLSIAGSDSQFISSLPKASSTTKNQYNLEMLISLYGNAASVALLDAECLKFACEHVSGVIGYRFKYGCAVVFGDPVCHAIDMPILLTAFHEFCIRMNKKIIFTAVSPSFNEWALKNMFQASIAIGEEVILNPMHDYLAGSQGRKLRSKVHQSSNANTKISEYHLNHPELQIKIEEAAAAWLKGRKGPQIYLAHVDLFNAPAGKRWFYAEKDEKIVGVLMLNKLEAKDGWIINLLMTTESAVHGTSELMVVNALDVLKKEGCQFLTVGTVPTVEISEINGFKTIAQVIAKSSFRMANRFFHLDGKKKYWKKFYPTIEPRYLVFEKARVGIREVLAIIRSLNASI